VSALRRTIFAICLLVVAAPSLADYPPFSQTPAPPPGLKPAYLDGIGIEQKLGQQVPLDLVFKDETGKSVRLGDYFDGKKPVVLTLVYYGCPMLCTLVLNDLTRGMNGLSLSAGDDYQVVTVSFDPKETPEMAASKKENYLRSYRRPHGEEGWHFLTGDEASIHELTQSVGFTYRWDPKYSQFVHPSGIMILTPSGTVSRYFFGIDYGLKDLKFSLQEASGNKIGSFSDQILLYCFHYDELSGMYKYSHLVINLVRAGGVLTLAGLGAFWFAMFRRRSNRIESNG
jgi:protein SCO1/2